jgi:hypothetical protein
MLNMRKIFAILNILALNGGNREMINWNGQFICFDDRLNLSQELKFGNRMYKKTISLLDIRQLILSNIEVHF